MGGGLQCVFVMICASYGTMEIRCGDTRPASLGPSSRVVRLLINNLDTDLYRSAPLLCVCTNSMCLARLVDWLYSTCGEPLLQLNSWHRICTCASMQNTHFLRLPWHAMRLSLSEVQCKTRVGRDMASVTQDNLKITTNLGRLQEVHGIGIER